jgi:hypothetical protein
VEQVFVEKGGPGIWTGHDNELLGQLAHIGGFTFEVLSIGHANFISREGLTYTSLAEQVLDPGGEFKVRLLGQSTWRTSTERQADRGWVRTLRKLALHLPRCIGF